MKAKASEARSSVYLSTARALTLGYFAFGFLGQGLPSISRLGFVFSIALLFWAGLGLATGRAKLPRPIITVALFWSILATSCLLASPINFDYLGRLSTPWFAGIGIAILTANGMGLRFVFWGLAVTLIVNIAAALIGIDVFLQVNQAQISMDAWLNTKRYSGLIGHPNEFALLASVCAFMFLAAYPKPQFKFTLTILGILLVVSYLTGSRSVLLSTVIFAGFGLFSSQSQSSQSTLISSTLILIAACGSAALFLTTDALRAIERSSLGSIPVVKRIFQALNGSDNSFIDRLDMVSVGLRLFAEKPLLGHGPDAYTYVSGFGLYSHNSFIEIAVNWGLFGLAAYIAVLIFVWPTLATGNSAAKIHQTASSIGIAVLVTGMNFWSNAFLNRPYVVLLCVVATIGAGVINTKRRSSNRGSRIPRI